jgi:hypothetical protein
MLASHAELARKLDALEKKYDAQFRVVFDAIRQLMKPPKGGKRELGFHTLRATDKGAKKKGAKKISARRGKRKR